MSYKKCPCCNSNLTINQFKDNAELCVYCTVKKESEKKEEQDLSNMKG